MGKAVKKASAAGENGATVDIPHEEIGHQANAVAVTPKIMTVEDQIKTELVKFNFTDAAIEQLKTNYGELTIKDETDKAGYEAVKKAWNDVRSKRTGLEKKGLEIRNNYTAITKAIKVEEVRLIDLLTPLEDDLYAKWKKIDDDKEKAKKEKEEAEGRQLMARIEELQTLGMSFKDGFYQIGDTITADVATLRAMPDDTFEKLKAAVITKNAQIVADRAAELFKKEQEQAEQRRQQLELQQQQQQLAEQQRQLDEQKAEMARQLRDLRVSKLQGLGMELEGDNVIKWETVRLYIATLVDMTAVEFAKVLDTTAEQIKDLKNKQAQEAERIKQETAERERREKYIADSLETAGLVYNWNTRSFNYKDDERSMIKTWDEMLEMNDGQIVITAQGVADQLLIWKGEQAKRDEMKQLDAQRQERLGLSDKQRWDSEIAQLEAQLLRVVPNEYKTAKFKKYAELIIADISEIIKRFK